MNIIYKTKLIGYIEIDEKYEIDLDYYCNELFGVNDKKHPGIALIEKNGKYVISGKIFYYKSFNGIMNNIYLDPSSSRSVMEQFKWRTILGSILEIFPTMGIYSFKKRLMIK